MRVAVGGVVHESNTFCREPMTVERFREKDLHFGAEILDHWRGTCSEVGGFIDGATRYRFELVPTMMAWGMPLGALSRDTFETLSGWLIDGLTSSRADGMFDLAVSGGGSLTVEYAKAGFLTTQRQAEVPWQDYVCLPDVMLVPLDAEATVVEKSLIRSMMPPISAMAATAPLLSD